MTLLDLIRSLEPTQLDALAERSGTSVGNLKQIAYGYRLAGPGLAINLDRESGRAVTCEELRPDIDWAYLRNSPTSSEQSAA
ncbi:MULTISPECIES: transcriptional regulator [Pseudomonas]|uniref:Helix-turn-helix domain-containing protein n=1 Tax=Pseudomonas azerbaijanoccidentalis TaxID=2842347 RepID=A0ABS6QL66_9PSED|nr:YdaS family helix-turn-helix protein [Pseudomonas azerbaijanoccidentalis]MBV4519697.1 helix-turn-helix domain-containing protein [Pseudomonas azerbaijanoccidentalis]